MALTIVKEWKATRCDRWKWPPWKLEGCKREANDGRLDDGGESNPAAPEFTQSDSLILRLSRLSRRAFSVFGIGAGPSNVKTLFLLQIHVSLLGRCHHADEGTSMMLHRNSFILLLLLPIMLMEA